MNDHVTGDEGRAIMSEDTAQLAALLNKVPDLDANLVFDWWRYADQRSRRSLYMYVGEALFADRMIQEQLSQLPRGSMVTEIGAGIGLLSHLIAARGHHVLAYEPESSGFGLMHTLSDLVVSAWIGPTADVEIRREAFLNAGPDAGTTDMIIAFNVIEHVPSPARFVAEATRLLSGRDGAHARFICPNYSFPYEPHFGLPTLIRKDWTWKVMGNRIARSEAIEGPRDFWQDLSWPSMRGLHRDLSRLEVQHRFSRDAAMNYVSRLDDPSFMDRKGDAFSSLRSMRQGLFELLQRLPVSMLPIVDLTTWRLDR